LLIAQRVIGSASDLSGSLSIGPSQLQLGPLGPVYGSAPPASNQSQKVHGFDHAYNLYPEDANQPTLDAEALNALLAAAIEANDSDAKEFAESAAGDSLTDLEILEPAILMIGDTLRAKLPAAH